jgi:transcriptional regulator GlxA family with amidase domain
LRVVRFPRCLSGRSAVAVRERMTRLLAEWRGRRPGRQLALKALLPDILLAAWRSPRRERIAPSRREPGSGARAAEGGRVGQVSAAVERIIHGCAGPLRLADLAAAARLSPAHFSEVFTRLIGMPPMRFLRRHRVRRAQSLLRLTDRRVSDIAAAVGYPDPYHFSRAFRAETGTSPSAYRREPGA